MKLINHIKENINKYILRIASILIVMFFIFNIMYKFENKKIIDQKPVIAYIDDDNSKLSKHLIKSLEDIVTLKRYKNRYSINEDLLNQKVDATFRIQKGFEEAVYNIKLEPDKKFESYINYIGITDNKLVTVGSTRIEQVMIKDLLLLQKYSQDELKTNEGKQKYLDEINKELEIFKNENLDYTINKIKNIPTEKEKDRIKLGIVLAIIISSLMYISYLKNTHINKSNYNIKCVLKDFLVSGILSMAIGIIFTLAFGIFIPKIIFTGKGVIILISVILALITVNTISMFVVKLLTVVQDIFKRILINRNIYFNEEELQQKNTKKIYLISGIIVILNILFSELIYEILEQDFIGKIDRYIIRHLPLNEINQIINHISDATRTRIYLKEFSVKALVIIISIIIFKILILLLLLYKFKKNKLENNQDNNIEDNKTRNIEEVENVVDTNNVKKSFTDSELEEDFKTCVNNNEVEEIKETEINDDKIEITKIKKQNNNNKQKKSKKSKKNKKHKK